eukprot:jgi/Bigna1/140501/aug1.56_g15209
MIRPSSAWVAALRSRPSLPLWSRALQGIRRFSGKSPRQIYSELVAKGRLKEDPSQIEALHLIEDLHTAVRSIATVFLPPTSELSNNLISDYSSQVTKYNPPSSKEGKSSGGGWLSSIFGSGGSSSVRGAPRGLYLYGGVGCGKTMLMDMFFDCVESERKRRVHFHAFMLDLHKRMHELRSADIKGDPIPHITQEIIDECWLLCFDEFQVTDIADALIMRRLFDSLWEKGLVMFCTSNRPPSDLYYNGIQRELFVPFIHECEERCHVHHLLSPTDYRLMGTQASVYVSPLNKSTAHFADQLFTRLTKTDPGVSPKEVELRGRTLQVSMGSFRNGVAKFTFQVGITYSTALKNHECIIAKKVILSIFVLDVPRLTRNEMNHVRRFITLVDAMYERRVKAVITADASPLELLQSDGGPEDELFAFDRTVSRLTEMQSLEYLANAGLKSSKSLTSILGGILGSSTDGNNIKLSSDQKSDLWDVYDADLNGEMTILEAEDMMRDICVKLNGYTHLSEQQVSDGYDLLSGPTTSTVSITEFQANLEALLEFLKSAECQGGYPGND